MEHPPINTCTGCRTCELACSFRHERTFNPEKSRIRVTRTEYGISYPVVCHQCSRPPCAKACPTRAITKNLESGLVYIDESLCVGCGLCVEKCPFGTITLHPDKKVAIKCDLCGGDPSCIKSCPERVLVLADINIAAQRTRAAWVKSKLSGSG
ncbi:MAG: 4Fe-4S dicluster domain-containing protein [Candidatus Hadarchaeales archaeon]